MQSNHVVVWLDHSEAHIIAFNREAAEAATIVHSSKHNVHQHQRGDRSNLGKAVADPEFYEDIITRIKAIPEWLIVGPAKAKLDFSKHLTNRHQNLVDHLIGLETVDHPSDGQLLAFAKKYFVAADRMAGVPTPS